MTMPRRRPCCTRSLREPCCKYGDLQKTRDHLKIVLAQATAPEIHWLLSRAYLQEGLISKALAAWTQSGSFRDENPDSTPSPVAVCAYHGHSRMSSHESTPRSKARVTPGLFFGHLNWGILNFLPRRIPNLANLKSHTRFAGLGQTDWNRKHTADGKVFRTMVDYAFGSGDRGLTLVGRDDNGQARELRLSYFRNETRLFWDVTSGHPLHPSDLTEYLGQTFDRR